MFSSPDFTRSAYSLPQRTFRALGSHCAITLALPPARQSAASDALDAAVGWIAEQEARFSRFIPTSELCALNRAAGTWFIASDDLFALCQAAFDWAQRSAGLFDPLILPELLRLGYDQDFAAIRHQDLGPSLPLAAPRATYRAIRLDRTCQSIWLPPGAAIDLGGIGKGWIADQLLMRVLADWPDVLVELGGDLALRGGPAPGQGWVIGLRDPRQDRLDSPAPQYLGGFALRSGGVATSGTGYRWWHRDGQRAHHLIDPRTGAPATLVAAPSDGRQMLAATAIAESAMAAEVWAKVALLRGLPSGLTALDGARQHAGLMILDDGTILPSANLHRYLAAHSPQS